MISLPNDVLYSIFHRMTVDAPLRSWSDEGVMIEPLFASHVCRRWRQVALSHGTLWSYLCIYDFGGPNPSRRKRMLDIFCTWLERTGKAPLNFSIRCAAENVDVEERRRMEFVVGSLLAEQQRWKDVRFDWHFRAYSRELTDIKLTDMPMLSSVSIDTYIRTCGGVHIIPYIDITRSQQLRYMRLDGGYSIRTGEDPFHSLRRMKHTIPSGQWTGVEAAEHCLAILRAFPNLVDYEVSIPMLPRPLPRDRTCKGTCFVHNVRRLVLLIPKGELAALVMDKLTLPELNYLRFYIDPTTFVPRHRSALLDFFERSRPRLERLDIHCCKVSSINLLSILRIPPSLQELIIEGCEDADKLFEGLTWSGDGPITCPMLRHIRLDPWKPLNGNALKRYVDALYEMAMSRGEGTTMSGTATFNNTLSFPVSSIHHEIRKIKAPILYGGRMDLYFELKDG